MSQGYTFPARLRLKSRKQIEQLFEEPASRFSHPLLIKYRSTQGDLFFNIADPQLAISVSKRTFKLASDRNLLKRRIREAYRLHWSSYLSGKPLSLMFIYVGKTKLSYLEIEKAMIRLLKAIQ
ncbi:MAG: ribonuclease P protein component [Saprospiraceae bacterium]|nr:ribonuclease P protein component [Saprospiraceae bacterium]